MKQPAGGPSADGGGARSLRCLRCNNPVREGEDLCDICAGRQVYCRRCRQPTPAESGNLCQSCLAAEQAAQQAARQQLDREADERRRGRVRCPHCGEYYRLLAGYCRHCGHVFGAIGDYALQSMCPFTIASIGGGGGVGGFSSEHYTWKHSPCMGVYCHLWDLENECCTFRAPRS
jgi:hypothetical protein